MKGRQNPFVHRKTSPSGVSKAKAKKARSVVNAAAVAEAAKENLSTSPSRLSKGEANKPQSMVTVAAVAIAAERSLSTSPTGTPSKPTAPHVTVVDISTLPIPARNPFLVAAEMVRLKLKKDTHSPDDVHIDRAPMLQPPPADLVLAGDVGYFRTNIEFTHDNNGRRVQFGTYYARYHYCTENDMVDYLVPSRYKSVGVKVQIARGKLLHWTTNMQASIMSVYFLGIQLLVEAMGGFAERRTSSEEQRNAIFKTLWESDEVAMAKAMLGMVAISVPISDIFSKSSPEHTKWQTFHRTMFLWAAENTYFLRVHGLPTNAFSAITPGGPWLEIPA